MKKLVIGIAALAVLGLMVGNVSAGKLNAGNTKFAAELISTELDSKIAQVNTAYEIEGPIAASTVLKVTLANAVFDPASSISLCDSAGTKYATGTQVGDDKSVITLSPTTTPMQSTTVYNFQTGGACVAFGAPLTNIFVAKGTQAGSEASMTIDSVLFPGDAVVSASAKIVTVVNQFSAALKPVTAKLQFPAMNTFVSDGKPAPPNTETLRTSAAVFLKSDESIPDGQKVAITYSGDCGTLPTLSFLRVKLAGSLSQLLGMEYNGNPYNFVAADITNSAAAYDFPGDQVKVCKVEKSENQAALSLVTAEDKAITPGVRNAELLLGSTGGQIPDKYLRSLFGSGAAFDIKLSSSLAYIPNLNTNTKAKVTCFVNNFGSMDAAVTADIVSSEQGLTKSGMALGTAKQNVSAKIVFEGSSVMGINGATTALGLGDKEKFSVRFNVDAPPEALTFFCSQTDPVSGGQKPIPVQTDGKLAW